nr:reverse transcriptase domain-containing protein [Tanacetum cinerariifolium]
MSHTKSSRAKVRSLNAPGGRRRSKYSNIQQNADQQPEAVAKSDSSRSCLSGYSDHPNYMSHTPGGRRRLKYSSIQQNDQHREVVGELKKANYGGTVSREVVMVPKFFEEIDRRQSPGSIQKKSTLLMREDESHDPEYSGPISVLDDGIYLDDSPSPVKHMQKTRKVNMTPAWQFTYGRRSNRRRVPNIVKPEIRSIEEVVPMADRTMEELLQSPTEGDVPNDAIKLMLFPYSIEGAARIWYEKEPSNSILTWDDLVNKFVNQFFPPSKTTHLKNEIFRFTQRFEETFGEAWERFKEMLRAFEIVNKQVIISATAKAVKKTCVICGGAHAYYDCIATDSNQPSVCAEMGAYNQVSSPNRASNQIPPPSFALVQNNQNSFFQNQALTWGTLLSNTLPNPKGEMKAVTTHSGLAFEGPSILTNYPLEKVVERETEEITDKEHSNCQGSTTHIQPLVVPISILKPDVPKTQSKPNIPFPSRINDQKLREKATNQMEKFFQIFHDLHFDISFADALLLMPKFTLTVKSLLTNKDKLFELVKVPLNNNYLVMLLKNLPENLRDPNKFLIPCDFPRIDVCHALADLGVSINLMPLSIWKKLLLPELTPTQMTFELADRSITHPKGVAKDVFIKVGKFHFPTDFVVIDFEADPRVPLILGRSFLRTGRTLIDVYGEKITLRVNDEFVTFNLNQTMRYSSTYDDNFVNRVDVLGIACKEFVLDVLDFQYNSKSSNPTLVSNPSFSKENKSEFSKEPIVKFSSPTITPFGENYKPTIQIKRRVNPKIHYVIKNEVIKLLDARMIYPISDSPWVTPIHCVPKKGGMTIVANENNKLIPTRSFLGHTGFYPRFIQDFPKIARPMTHLLKKEIPFVFSKDCIDAFDTLKKKLTEATILVVPDWNLPFELMCDASDFVIGVVVRQLYAFEKFRPYLVLSKSIVYTDHSALKYLLSKQDAKQRLPRWVLLLQEFDITICDKKGSENLAADHLSRLENPHKDVLENKDINENFPLETLGSLSSGSTPWTVRENHASWSDKLDDALWAFRTAFKTPIGCTPYKLVYGKSCHLPIELDHKLYWALKHVNFDLKTTGDHRKLQLNKLNELRVQAYENSLIYKERTKKLHDSNIKNHIFNVGDQVLLFNSLLKIFSGKLWS